MIIKDKRFQLFISREQIQTRVQELAVRICTDYQDKNPLFVVILNGAFVFAADLIRCIHIPSAITFVKFTSYIGEQSSGRVDEIIGLQEDVRDRHLIVIEDIIDTGLTITEIIKELKKFTPASIEVASLLRKPDALKRPVHIEYCGFDIENKFVVGYGLDYDGYGRNLTEIRILAE
jgi:hypoxanthine phosphoribosyltransferase